MDIKNEKLNTIGKAVAIIEMIQEANQPLSIKYIAESLGYNKSSLHHHIKTLTEKGYLQRNEETRKYDIGLNLVRVGQSYLQRLDVRERGHFAMEKLSRKLSETVHMLVLDKNEVVYVDKVDVNHQPEALQCSSFIGQRTDVYSTAAGKVMLSFLERGDKDQILDNITLAPKTKYTITTKAELLAELDSVKEMGFARDLEEHVPGLQCIAVPVMNMHSQCVAAVSVSCPISLISREMLEGDVLTQLKLTGREISVAMGYIANSSYSIHS